MNSIYEQPQTSGEIEIHIRMTNGEIHIQPLPLDYADGADDLMNWFRDPKAGPVWTWHCLSGCKLTAIARSSISAIDIYGYIEPEGNKVKWYQKIADKVRVNLFLFAHKRMRFKR